MAERFGVVIVFVSCLVAFSLAAADVRMVALCPNAENLENATYQHTYYAADGNRQTLTVTQEAFLSSACTAAMLPITGSVLWAAPAPFEQADGAIRKIGLLGRLDSDLPEVSEIIINPGKVARSEAKTGSDLMAEVDTASSVLPLDRSVLYQFAARPFGIEERVSVDGADHLLCRPGHHVAGAFLKAGRPWATGKDLQLEIRARGRGRFGVAAGDARRDTRETPLRLGDIVLPDSGNRTDIATYRFDLPNNDQGWTSLTLLCPDKQAELHLVSLTLRSPDGRMSLDQPVLNRGAWFWSPQFWQQHREIIWRAQEQQQLTEVYLSIPVDDGGNVADKARLNDFIADADARGLDVWVVIGDPRDVLPESWSTLEARIRAMLAYNREVAEPSRIRGIQLDIEPYRLRGFVGAQAYWRDRYVSVIRRAHEIVDQRLPLDLVVPAWWGHHLAWGNELFRQLPVVNTRLTIMNYYTAFAPLRRNAEPFLQWGQEASVPVVIALESGALPDQTHRQYSRHEDTGELWRLSVDDASILMLFDQPQTDLPGQAFTFTKDYPVPASDYTFAGDLDRLNAVVRKLISEWQVRSAFAGIAIHGLDDVNALPLTGDLIVSPAE